jgi:hypothetical protein
MTARLAALTAALVLGPSAAGQPPAGEPADPPPSLDANGSELFRGLFHYHGIEPVGSSALQGSDLKNTIVVLLGLPTDKQSLTALTRHTKRVLSQGGAVLIVVEEKIDLSPFFPDPCLIGSTGERVYHPKLALGGYPQCPFVLPKEPGSNQAMQWAVGKSPVPPEWTLFLNLKKVATNAPGALDVTAASKYAPTEVAEFPPDSRVGGQRGLQLQKGRVFAVAGAGLDQESPFRCLVLADPSVFHNQMMVVPDAGGTALGTDNLAFADNVVRFLKGPQERSRCFFVEAGTWKGEFDTVNFAEQATPDTPPIPPIPVPPPPDLLNPGTQRALTDAVNRRVAGWQDRNGPNRLIVGNPSDDRRFVTVLRFLAVALAVFVFLWLVRRVWAARQVPEVSPVPTDTGRVAASGAAGSLARRKEELLQSGQYADVLREYLQELFAARGLPLPVPKPVGKLPPVEITGRGATTLRDQLRILWEVAFGPNPQPISYARWKELEPMLDAVRTAADEGRWRFVGGSA